LTAAVAVAVKTLRTSRAATGLLWIMTCPPGHLHITRDRGRGPENRRIKIFVVPSADVVSMVERYDLPAELVGYLGADQKLLTRWLGRS
jgi:hypothetical protein